MASSKDGAPPAKKKRAKKPAKSAKAETKAPSRKGRPKKPAPDAFEVRIGYAFSDKALLQEALTHTSVGGRRGRAISYERMEFFGDRVLGLVVAQILYERFPEAGEDALAPRLNALVSRTACARAARRIDLGAALRMAPSEVKSGGREKETILADACEALIAAIYFDAASKGLAAAKKFIEAAWGDDFAGVEEAPRDPKTTLQEWAAQRRRPNPHYAVVERTGPDHAPYFIVEARVEGVEACRGAGGSKRDAEREAARAMLKSVGVHV